MPKTGNRKPKEVVDLLEDDVTDETQLGEMEDRAACVSFFNLVD